MILIDSQDCCFPGGSTRNGAQDYITFVKDANFAGYQTGSGSLVMLIVCLVIVLLMCVVVTALVLYYMRNKGRAYRAILQDLAVPKEENSRKEGTGSNFFGSFFGSHIIKDV